MKINLHRIVTISALTAFILVTDLPAWADVAGQAWAQLFTGNTNGSSQPAGMVTDSAGNVIVTGYSTATNVSPQNADFLTIKYSNAGVPLWTNRFNGRTNYDDSPVVVAVDTNDNVFVAGYSTTTNASPYTYQYATIKYSNAGVPLWTNRFNGPGNDSDQARAMAVDVAGNVLVAGTTTPDIGVAPGIVTIKYSNAGGPLWTNRFFGSGGYSDTYASLMAVGTNGNVAVAGYAFGSSGADYVTVEYSGAGTPLWTNYYNGTGNSADEPSAIAFDRSNNVVVTGYSVGNGLGYDFATVKYSTAGVPLWTNRYSSAGNATDVAYGTAVDASNNVVVTGYSTRAGTGEDVTTIKYSGAGVPLWTNFYNGPANNTDAGYAVTTDASGNIFITGYTYGLDSKDDYLTIKYSGIGVALWTNLYTGPANTPATANALALDRNGNVFVAGTSFSSHTSFLTVRYSESQPLAIEQIGTKMVLIWTNTSFRLQSSPLITAGFTNVTGATSPFTNNNKGTQQYFRLISN